MSLDKYFDTIRDYVPQDAKAILDAQIPQIRDEVKRSVDEFGERLGEHVKQRIEELTKEQDQYAQEATDRLKAVLAGVDSQGGIDANKVAELKSAVDAYEARWKGIGEKMKTAAINAVRSTGVPVPSF